MSCTLGFYDFGTASLGLGTIRKAPHQNKETESGLRKKICRRRNPHFSSVRAHLRRRLLGFGERVRVADEVLLDDDGSSKS